MGLGRQAARGAVLGGFDAARGGTLSLRDSASLANLRSELATAFPGSTITATGTLTPAYLNNLDVLWIAGPTSNTTATTALSAAEQSALAAFVSSGKGVILVTDNDTFTATADAVHESFLDPFGLDATGTLSGGQTSVVTPAAPTHPVTNGPFGTVTSWSANFPGWFNNPGTATVLTRFGLTQPSLAVLDRDAVALGSGPVIFVSDTHPFVDLTPLNNRAVALNAFAHAVPEPAAGLVLLATTVLIMSRRRQA
jgi:hypothetical protein